jgi:hypothetical protein
VGVPFNEHEIYGSALVKAYNLENSVALYPRIVIGKFLKEYIGFVKERNSNHDPENIVSLCSLQMAHDCERLITPDYDKNNILDVIGDYIKSIPGGIQKKWVEDAYKFIIKSQESNLNSQKLKLAVRYGLLRNYFESRLTLWDIRNIN